MKNEKGIQISDAEMKSVQLTPADFTASGITRSHPEKLRLHNLCVVSKN